MEEVRTSIEKLFDSYEANSQERSNAKRLSYSFLNDSRETRNECNDGSPAVKRSCGILNDTSCTSANLNNSFNISSFSAQSTMSTQSTQWETRILKADLIEANSKVLQLKKEVQDRLHVHKNMEQLYESKLKNMQNQLEASENRVKVNEKYIRQLKKKTQAEKNDLEKMKNEMARQKHNYDSLVHGLQLSNQNLETNLREVTHNLNIQINALNLQLSQCQKELETTRDEVIELRERQRDLSTKANEVDKINGDLEKERYQFSVAQRKIKELESEISNHGDWKNMSKAFQARLAKVTELERDCERLTRDNKNLHETIGNKMLLEEQVHDLKTRLENRERINDQSIELRTQLQSLEQEVKDWKRLAKDYCSSNTPQSPSFLRSFIDELQKKIVILTSDAGSINRDKASADDQLIDLRKQNESLQKNVETLNTTLRSYKNHIHRMQKKLMLVAKERECFKTLLENYEKDLTISAQTTEINIDAELRTRLEVVERSLSEYKDICATLEQELDWARANGTGDAGIMRSNTEQYEHMKKELEKMTFENERLQRRKNELELIVEQTKLKENIGITNGEREFKVVHMSMNPSEEAYENYKNEVNKLKAEIERLKLKNRKLEEQHDDLTSRLNETTAAANMTTNIQDVAALRSQIESLEAKQQHYKEIYRAASLEFREVIYLLFGYRVDRIYNNNYRIISMFAEHEEEYLNFRLNEMGELDMLETEFSNTLHDMVSNYLAQHHSMPAFLSSLTLDLFQRQTMAAA